MGFLGTLGFREAFQNLKKKFERKKNINHKTSKKKGINVSAFVLPVKRL